MFPAPPGYVARYENGKGDAVRLSTRPVVAFDEDGLPYVAQFDRRCLAPADAFRGYEGIDEAPHPPTVALLPADGWRIEHADAEGHTWSQPLVGWAARTDGSITALTTDSDGYAVEPSGKFRIYHPDEKTSEKTTTKEAD